MLLAPLGAALAAPQSIRHPLLPAEDGNLLDSVAERGAQLVTQVRAGAAGLVDSALGVLGVRYKFGGSTIETGFDCSGFTRYVFENSIGRVLPHRADEQANDPSLTKVDHKDLKPGDLVFFNTMRRTFSHVGIYLGDGKFIHSPRTGESVRIEDINIAYWARRFTGARRAPELADDKSTGSMLAALRARLSGQPAPAAASPADATTPPAPMAPPTLLASAQAAGPGTGSPGTSGLRNGGVLPGVAVVTVAGFVPGHEPSLPPMSDR